MIQNQKNKKIRIQKLTSVFISLILLLAFTCSVFADGNSVVRPSIGVKDVSIVPEEVLVEDPDHPGQYIKKFVAGTLLEVVEDKEEVVKYYDISEVYLTPYAQKDNIPYVRLSLQRKSVIKTNLEDAYDNIAMSDTLANLNPELEARAKEYNENYNSWVFVASDIFDLSLDEAEEARLSADPNAHFRLKIKLTHPSSLVNGIVVMHCPQSTKEWTLLPDENVIQNEDGTVTLILDNLCPIVVMAVQPERMLDYEANAKAHCNCPSWCPFCGFLCTHGACYCWLAYLIIVIVIILIVVYIIRKNKKNKGNNAKA